MRIAAAFATCLLLAAGCAVPETAPRPPARPFTAPAAAPPPSLSQPEQEAWRHLQSLRARLQDASGMKAEFEAFSTGYYNGGRREKTLRKAISRSRMLWSSPERMRFEVVKTASPLMAGAVLATPDGQVMWAKGGGVLSVVPLKLDPDDPRLASNRNHGFKDSNPVAQLRRLTGAGAVWSPRSGSAGSYAVTGVPRLDAEIDAEVVTLEPATSQLISISALSKGQKVAELRFDSLEWNPSIAGNPFRL